MIHVGHGYDVHAFSPDRPCILGGVTIPHHQGLLGHSDADVLIHALCDALLGSAALGDIGTLFPPDDPEYKDISSIILLTIVRDCLAGEGWMIVNADVTLIAEKPIIAPYIPEMIENICNALLCPDESISIKATTTEKLGYIGREEGIAAHAVCLVEDSLTDLRDDLKRNEF